MLTEHPVPHNSPLLSSKIVWIITLLLIQIYVDNSSTEEGKEIVGRGHNAAARRLDRPCNLADVVGDKGQWGV
jgi:hypothetical protein